MGDEVDDDCNSMTDDDINNDGDGATGDVIDDNGNGATGNDDDDDGIARWDVTTRMMVMDVDGQRSHLLFLERWSLRHFSLSVRD